MNGQPLPAAGQAVAQQGPQGPVFAAPNQPPANLPFQPQPQGPHSYVAFYNDAANDPYHGEYTNAMQVYKVPLNNGAALQPAALANQVYASASTVPMSFVMLCRDPTADAMTDPGRVVLFHRVSKFAARIGMPATPWDDRAYAFKGDVHHRQLVTVNWEQDYFHQVQAQLRVPTVEQANQQLAANPPPLLLGPFNNNDAGTDVIRTRRTMYVPPRYVSLFLAEDMPPAVAYNRFVAVATADGTMNACAPLVDWLRASVTRSTANDVSALETAYPTVPMADAALINHRWEIATRDLSSLDPARRRCPP